VRPAELGAAPKPDAYIPIWQEFDVLQWFSSATILARGRDPRALSGALRPAVLALDPQSPPFNIRLLDEDISRIVAGPRFSATVLGLFAVIALVMASLGVYGVMSYAASLRTREIGIRMAIGGTRAQVLGLMLKDGASTVIIGLVAGLAVAVLLSRTLTGLLYEVTPADPLTILTVAAVLCAAGLAASFVPARRAATIDPLQALREE
jgi:ABC-type antimicrobial peptide transport system permease subunit